MNNTAQSSMSKLVVTLLVIIVAAILIIYIAYTFWGSAEETGSGFKPENLLFAPDKFLAEDVLVRTEVFREYG